MNKFLQVLATREAGAVRRCHIIPHHGQYNIAQHSYGALSLLLLLHPGPSLALIKAVQWHDVGERWLGDMPAPAKYSNPELGRVYEEAEQAILETLELAQVLTEEETQWLKAVDTLDLWLWCWEEHRLGNKRVQQMFQVCFDVLMKRHDEGTLPGEVRFFVDNFNSNRGRLSDFFEEAMADGPGKARG